MTTIIRFLFFLSYVFVRTRICNSVSFSSYFSVALSLFLFISLTTFTNYSSWISSSAKVFDVRPSDTGRRSNLHRVCLRLGYESTHHGTLKLQDTGSKIIRKMSTTTFSNYRLRHRSICNFDDDQVRTIVLSMMNSWTEHVLRILLSESVSLRVWKRHSILIDLKDCYWWR